MIKSEFNRICSKLKVGDKVNITIDSDISIFAEIFRFHSNSDCIYGIEIIDTSAELTFKYLEYENSKDQFYYCFYFDEIINIDLDRSHKLNKIIHIIKNDAS
jgi:hypothetical protein